LPTVRKAKSLQTPPRHEGKPGFSPHHRLALGTSSCGEAFIVCRLDGGLDPLTIQDNPGAIHATGRLAQLANQSTEAGAISTGFLIRRQRGTGAGETAEADQPLQQLDQQRRDWQNPDQPDGRGHRILGLRQAAAAAADVRVVPQHRVNPPDRQRLRPRSGMARQSRALADTAFVARQLQWSRQPIRCWNPIRRLRFYAVSV
jgi:hypothetical protein